MCFNVYNFTYMIVNVISVELKWHPNLGITCLFLYTHQKGFLLVLSKREHSVVGFWVETLIVSQIELLRNPYWFTALYGSFTTLDVCIQNTVISEWIMSSPWPSCDYISYTHLPFTNHWHVARVKWAYIKKNYSLMALLSLCQCGHLLQFAL